jgi:F-type H+-transporting ATPase subunit a
MVFAQHEYRDSTSKHIEHTAKTEEFNFSEMILHHISDSHEWHLATVGHTHLTIPLPVILYSQDRGLEIFSSHAFHSEGEQGEGSKEEHIYKGYYINEETHKINSVEKRTFYDFSITKNVMSMFFSLALLCVIFIGIANRYKKNPNQAPKGIQSLFEPLIIFVRDEVVKPNIGEHQYQKFLPYMLTLFFFIWFNNLLGLLPGGANLTGNIAITLVLALLTLILTLFNAKADYWKHIFAPQGIPAWLLPIMIPVEILGIFTKPMALTVRLFANITGGHIVILSFIGLIFLFKNLLVATLSIPLVIAMTFLELLVGFLQAYIFTLLSSMYIGSAVEEHGGHDIGH